MRPRLLPSSRAGLHGGLVKGADLDSRAQDGNAALIERLNILDAAANAGIHIDLDGHGIGAIYSRSELEDQT